MGIHQQSQAQEHDNLEEPGHAAHKSSDLLTVYNACVTHHHSCYIDSQIAVSFTQVGHGECEENKAQQQDRIERLVLQVNLVDDYYRQFSQQES